MSSNLVQTKPRTFAEAEIILAERLPGYEARPQQQAMAAFVEDVFASEPGTVGLAQAGCGTGKSLGAMIPAILSGQRTVVATATIALMEQYASKDVPFLQEKLGVPFSWALLKGRSNYVCQAKILEAKPEYTPSLPLILAELRDNPEHDGDREHFSVQIDKAEFSNVAMSSAECPGKRECPFGATCFAEAAKARAQASQVVVTNAAMLMTDLKVREMTDGFASMLGDWDATVVDEGHELEEIATSQLEEVLRPSSLDKMVKEATNLFGSQAQNLLSGSAVTDAVAAVSEALPQPEGKDGMRLTTSWFVEHQEPFVTLLDALHAFRAEVLDLTVENNVERSQAWQARLARRASNAIENYGNMVVGDDNDVVRWVEVESRRMGGDVKVLHYAPINVGPFLQQWLYADRTTVLVSATLSTGASDFSYIQNRLGLQGCKTIDVGTPFDYDTQAMLFVPDKDQPSPKNRNVWLNYSAMVTQEMIRAAGGGALLLFTSTSAMRAAREAYGWVLEDMGFTVLMQGEGTNKTLAKTFAEDTHSVLFALKSFFTGVDIPGDACRLVVIDKLPFPVPSDPVFAARSASIEKDGGSGFSDLSIPMMTLVLTQGYGRLIRTTKDFGVVAILDSRLTSTGWGRKIVGNLPESPATTSLAQVKAFYEAKRA